MTYICIIPLNEFLVHTCPIFFFSSHQFLDLNAEIFEQKVSFLNTTFSRNCQTGSLNICTKTDYLTHSNIETCNETQLHHFRQSWVLLIPSKYEERLGNINNIAGLKFYLGTPIETALKNQDLYKSKTRGIVFKISTPLRRVLL